MSNIHLLDENTINQIAAGEVVERPSAVVKELVENAMDAQATAVTVEIKDGGLSFIRITDNGSGIAREDIPLAFMRHATSKIYKAEDLLCITSLGFRGEALSSIAAVAQVELITKTPSALNGYRYIIEGGVEKSIEEIGCPSGTTIIVRNLFYNTPARRKFLKSASAEAGYIGDLMEKVLVAHPEVAFKYIVNNQIKLQSSGNNNSRDILYSIYGRELVKDLLSLNYDSDRVKVRGFIGKPSVNRSNRGFENYFINGRYVKNPIITKAIEDAYKPYLMQHKYPFTSLYLEIEPSLIDVNVHPQKMELRLRNSEEIYQLLFSLIRSSLGGNELIPQVSLTTQDDQNKDKQNQPVMPEPFETNRRKQFETQINEVRQIPSEQKILSGKSSSERHDYEYNRRDYGYQKLADKNTDYITATRPLIQADIRLPGIPVKPQEAQKQTKLGAANALPDETTEENSEQNHNQAEEKPFSGNNTDIQNMITADNGNLANIADDKISHTDDVNTADIQTADAGKLIAQQMTLFEAAASDENVPFLSDKALDEHRIIGQLFSTYWLVEYKKQLYIIDQHAAHEKVLYERLMAAVRKKTIHSQQLLPPIVITLTLKEQDVLKKHEDVLKSLGYEFEHFSGNEYQVRAVPADLNSISEKALLLEFIDELTDEVTGGLTGSTSVIEKIASLSCKAAVKANHTLSYEEAKALIKELLTLENPYNCPHGRPVIVSMSQYELERKFKRVL